MHKAAVVTGSTKGIGKATAIRLLESGYYVYMNYAHDECAAKALAVELDEKGYSNEYRIIRADMSSIKGIEEFVACMNFEEHSLEKVVLNASTNGRKRSAFRDITPEEMTEMFSTNLFAPFFLIQKLADRICEGGAVVFVSSHVGIYPHSTYIPYGLTKSCVIFLAKMLVKEFEDRRITVNAVAPAFIETNMFPGNRSAEHIESIRSKVAVHRFGQADEVANAIVSILENGYMNGCVVSLDGGYDYR